MTSIDLKPFRVIQVSPNGRDLSEPSELPFAENYLQSADAMSSFNPDRTMRRYLIDLLNGKNFKIVSPLTGRLISSGTSIVLNDKSVFYGFPEEPDLYIGVDNLGAGFPMSAALITSQRTLLTTGNAVWGINEQSSQKIDAIIAQTGWQAVPASEPLRLLCGDPNFAHHAWNQLPCLQAAIQLSKNFSIVSTNEPLGSLPDLFPELTNTQIERLPSSWLERANGPGKTFVPLGSTLLPASVIERISSLAGRHLSNRASLILSRLKARNGPAFWLSIRTRNRTVVNQIELLSNVGKRIFETFPGAIILLDGHSLPRDIDTNRGSYDTAQAESAVVTDNLIAEEIVQLLSPLGAIIPIVGLPITEAILIAQEANFYFCHHGTVQHKIGWFSDASGIIHSNKRTLIQNPAKWVAYQSAIATEPTYLSPDMVVDEAYNAPDNPQQRELRLENYTCQDTMEVANFFVTRILHLIAEHN